MKIERRPLVIIISIIILGSSLIYFFSPKTVAHCGSMLDSSCYVYTCERGFLITNVGGGVTCVGGSTPTKEESIFDHRCAGEGESVCTAVGCKIECCPGLETIPLGVKFESGCSEVALPGAGAVCTNKCGNGVCDSDAEENECNCPQDCK
jgi:hypothetical protein